MQEEKQQQSEVNATYFDGMKVWFTPQGADEMRDNGFGSGNILFL